MTRRQILLLALSLYPAWWRRRYGAEVAAILEQSPATVRDTFDLFRGAFDAWIRQRPPEGWHGRFGDEAREVVMLAQQEARALRHNYVGTEHILLGLLAAPDSVAARTLTTFGVSPQGVRARVLQIVGQGFASPDLNHGYAPSSADLHMRSMCLTPRTKRTFERSCHAADRLGDRHVDSAHLLLGLLGEQQGIGAMIVAEFVETVRVPDQLARFRHR